MSQLGHGRSNKIIASNATWKAVPRVPDMKKENEFPQGMINFNMKENSYDVTCSGPSGWDKKFESVIAWVIVTL